MSTSVHVKPRSYGTHSWRPTDGSSRDETLNFSAPAFTPTQPIVNPIDPIPGDESAPNSDDEDDTPRINDVESLKKGILKTSKTKVEATYTILVVGETGVGKSSVLEFIANVLGGKSIDQYNLQVLDQDNEEGGSSNRSQTNAARLYSLRSKNGISVRILDTPGLADTRGLQQDEIHKKSIATQIQTHIDFVSAVIILANGTVPRITVGTDYALSTLSSIFPKTLANNIAFLFTNVSSPLSWNFSQDTVPDVLKDAPQYLLDNPIALQKKYLKLKDDPNMKKVRTELRKAVKAGEQKALEMLVELFDWVDGLKVQPTTEILSLYEKSQTIRTKITNTLAQMDQAAVKKAEIDKLMNAFKKDSADMDAFSNFENTVQMPVWKQQPTTSHNTLCGQTSCYSNCHMNCALDFSLDPKGLKGCAAMNGETCYKCHHSLWDHHHHRVKWEQVIDQQVSVDEEMKRKWEAAKNGKEKTAALIQAGEHALNELSHIIDRATDDLAQLAEDYSNLSLSGSFSAQVEKAIRLLEQSYRSMEEKGVGQEQLRKVKDGLDHMTKKLELLKKANEKARMERGMRSRVKNFLGLN